MRWSRGARRRLLAGREEKRGLRPAPGKDWPKPLLVLSALSGRRRGEKFAAGVSVVFGQAESCRDAVHGARGCVQASGDQVELDPAVHAAYCFVTVSSAQPQP